MVLLEGKAYLKIMLHAAKHPTLPICGYLIGRNNNSGGESEESANVSAEKNNTVNKQIISNVQLEDTNNKRNDNIEVDDQGDEWKVVANTRKNNNNNSSMNHHIINNENASKSFLEALPKEHLWVITDKALNRETGYKSRFIGFDNEIGCSVEELVLQHFQLNEGGWTGLHCEGSPMRTLFGLLMWDVIFIDDVPNVFATAFQRCPLDFGMEEFALILRIFCPMKPTIAY